jgi:ankyrin repeat protein
MALIAAGVDINSKGFRGQTPLHAAATTYKTAMLKAVIAARNAGRTNYSRALETALRDNTAMVTAVISAGADVNAKDRMGSQSRWS